MKRDGILKRAQLLLFIAFTVTGVCSAPAQAAEVYGLRGTDDSFRFGAKHVGALPEEGAVELFASGGVSHGSATYDAGAHIGGLDVPLLIGAQINQTGLSREYTLDLGLWLPVLSRTRGVPPSFFRIGARFGAAQTQAIGTDLGPAVGAEALLVLHNELGFIEGGARGMYVGHASSRDRETHELEATAHFGAGIRVLNNFAIEAKLETELVRKEVPETGAQVDQSSLAGFAGARVLF